MNDLEIIKRDIKCLMDYKDKEEARFENRKPASETILFMGKINTEIELMKQEFKTLSDTIHQSDQRNEEQHRRIISDLGVFTAQNKALYENLKEDVEKNYVTKESSWAEKVLAWVGGIILTILVTAAMVLIIKDGLLK